MKDLFLIAIITISIFFALTLHFRPTHKAVESDPISLENNVQIKNNQNEEPNLNSKSDQLKLRAEVSHPIKNETLSEDQIALRALNRPANAEKIIHCDPNFRNTDDLITLREKQKIILINPA